MEQGTNEWLEWRKQGIGASESAVLLGLDPYGKTPYKLWLEKKGGKAEDTEASPGLFQRGHETEAMVRASLELELGMDFPPALFELPGKEHIRASLDGWCEEATDTPKGIEIKMVGAKAMLEPIPQHHYIQMQHQMLVTAQPAWMYLRHNDGVTQKHIVKEDPATQIKIVEACDKFWEMVQTQTPPAFTDQDWVPVDDVELDLTLKAVMEAPTPSKKAPHRMKAFALAAALRLGNRLENMVDGPARGAKIQISPTRIWMPKGGE